MITYLIKSPCDISGIKCKRHRKIRNPNKKPWFDQECQELKQDLIRLGKQVSREKIDSNVRKDLFLKKKNSRH